jgi:hypothetical protein
MADLDELATAMPLATKEATEHGRPAYFVHGKLFCFHRGRRLDAVDPATGERLHEALMFRVEDFGVKELLLADERGPCSACSRLRSALLLTPKAGQPQVELIERCERRY